MKFDTLAVASLFFLSAPSLAHPQPAYDVQVVRDDAAHFEARDADLVAGTEDLWKRKGGGGGGGKGGGGSSGGKGGSSSSGGSSSGKGGSSSSGSSGSTSSSGKSSGKGSSTSTTGGQTKQGSGVQPSFGGGKYYGGGATSPYAAGVRSPLGITPLFLGVGAVALLPGLWYYGAYSYPYHHPYTFYNHSAPANGTNSTDSNNSTDSRRDILVRDLLERDDLGANQTKPVTCLCAAYAECGCDDSGNTTFLNSLIGDGTYSKLNLSLVNVADVNGTSTILLNGTLPNGTTIPGGTEDADGAAGGMQGLMQSSGYLVMVALAACTVLLV